MDEDNTIGARLRQARRERALTQDELSQFAGVSRDLIAKLEQGQRTTARITTLTALSKALGVDLSRLLGRRERLANGHGGGILAIRDVLLSIEDLPGIDLAADTGEPTPLPDLNAAVTHAWDAYWQGRLGDLSRMLPGLVGEARLTERTAGVAAAVPLAQAYQLCADLMVHMGRDDLAAVAANRALSAAGRGNDELQHATILGTASWVLLHQGRTAEAEQVAAVAAGRIEPRLSAATPAHLTVWGSLLLSAAAPAAAGSRLDEAYGYLGLARAAAGRFREDRHDYQVSFGPSQVAMQQVHASSVLGRPGDALKSVPLVDRADLLHISWGAHQLDVAQALLDAHRGRDAEQALWEAHAVSAEWFRHQVLARALVREAVESERRLSPSLRKLAASVGIR